MKNIKKKKSMGTVVTASLAGSVMLLFAFAPLPQKNKPWVTPDAQAKVANPLPANDQTIAEGKKVYASKCNDCHGKKGKGDGPKSADLDVSPMDFTKADFQKQPDGALYWKISEGRKPMPAFKSELSKEQRWQVINYIRTLK